MMAKQPKVIYILRQRIRLTISLAAATYGLPQSPSGNRTERRDVATFTWTQDEHTVAKSTNSSFSRPFKINQIDNLRRGKHAWTWLIMHWFFLWYGCMCIVCMLCVCSYLHHWPCMHYIYIKTPCWVKSKKNHTSLSTSGYSDHQLIVWRDPFLMGVYRWHVENIDQWMHIYMKTLLGWTL